MGLAVRVFLVADDGYLRRLPFARYERLLRGEAEGFLPQYARRRVRYALVSVRRALVREGGAKRPAGPAHQHVPPRSR